MSRVLEKWHDFVAFSFNFGKKMTNVEQNRCHDGQNAMISSNIKM